MDMKVTSYRLPVYVLDYLVDIMNELNKNVVRINHDNTLPIKNFSRADVLEHLIRAEHVKLFPERYEK